MTGELVPVPLEALLELQAFVDRVVETALAAPAEEPNDPAAEKFARYRSQVRAREGEPAATEQEDEA